MKLAISSDEHLDINRQDLMELIPRQAEFLQEAGVDHYLLTGDLFNDFEQTFAYVERLQRALGRSMRVYFVAGNHDMLRGVTYDQLEQPELLGPHYLHHRVIHLPGTKVSLVGNNGWYDYSLADSLATARTAADFQQWKNTYWIDRRIAMPLSDQERMARVLQQVELDLKIARERGDEILFITHFVPRRDFIFDQLDHPRWQNINGLLGSQALGQLLQQYQVERVAFGHLHTRQRPVTIAGTTYFHAPVGYGLRRLNEWRESNFLAEWQRDLSMIEFPSI
ncbi:metallophosphoesterase [Lapidilactobacillus luobeiensis]|uniref:metallophosphoesterase n=1 Tax=Lapidilactobacillus luobeiensis TaxID=2950371 RepID=UPI0021C2F7F1|nr:metallophosphoesterase [Lapidilactobacillus luobeiensis]